MGKTTWLFGVLCLAGCTTGPPDIHALLAHSSGTVELPAGLIEVSREIKIPERSHDLVIVGAPEGTTLRVSAQFRGRAILSMSSSSNVTLRNLRFDGNRAVLEKPVELPPSDVSFAAFYNNNGILAEDVDSLTITRVKFSNITNYAVLVSRCRRVLIDRIEVTDSGSRNKAGRNNASGGVILEEGTAKFVVRDSVFRNIRGNGVWTHSLYTSPRNRDGLIQGNRFYGIARDAIQIGHATNVRVVGNTGEQIGYPIPEVDVEGGAVPVAIDTAGNVDHTAYLDNTFQEINGKCIDLDGFHDGEVRRNTCINRGKAEDYPFGHFGIVMNNANPDMSSTNIVIADNVIDGTKFGGIFVIGTRHKIIGNRLLHLNKAHCNENAAKFGCAHFPGEPDLLQSGIYLGQRAERPSLSLSNVVENNEISGFKMSKRCIAQAPKIPKETNLFRNNRCSDTEAR